MAISIDPLPFGNDNSAKDIPTPAKKEYKCKSIVQGGKFLNNLRWRIWHYLKRNENIIQNKFQDTANNSSFFTDEKEDYGLKQVKPVQLYPKYKNLKRNFGPLLKV